MKAVMHMYMRTRRDTRPAPGVKHRLTCGYAADGCAPLTTGVVGAGVGADETMGTGKERNGFCECLVGSGSRGRDVARGMGCF